VPAAIVPIAAPAPLSWSPPSCHHRRPAGGDRRRQGQCGIPEYHDGHIHYSGTPELMGRLRAARARCRRRIIGGCCGTSPEHLAAMRGALDCPCPRTAADVALVEERLGAVSALAKGYDAAASAGERRERRRRS
jgi:5-methyltetrahydrofolate--homocysteine methyltransferase